MQESFSTTSFNIVTPAAIYKIKKRLFINNKYMHNLYLGDYDLVIDHLYTKNVILPIISFDLFKY